MYILEVDPEDVVYKKESSLPITVYSTEPSSKFICNFLSKSVGKVFHVYSSFCRIRFGCLSGAKGTELIKNLL